VNVDDDVAELRRAVWRLALLAFAAGAWAGAVGVGLWLAGRGAP
jgi:hypothetical protein